MTIVPVTETFSVSEQLEPADLAELKAQGVEVLICNRPDGDGDGQPTFSSIKQAAEELGIDTYHIPFAPGAFTADDCSAFARVLAEGKVTHAYCRTGRRSQTIYTAAT